MLLNDFLLVDGKRLCERVPAVRDEQRRRQRHLSAPPASAASVSSSVGLRLAELLHRPDVAGQQAEAGGQSGLVSAPPTDGPGQRGLPRDGPATSAALSGDSRGLRLVGEDRGRIRRQAFAADAVRGQRRRRWECIAAAPLHDHEAAAGEELDEAAAEGWKVEESIHI